MVLRALAALLLQALVTLALANLHHAVLPLAPRLRRVHRQLVRLHAALRAGARSERHLGKLREKPNTQNANPTRKTQTQTATMQASETRNPEFTETPRAIGSRHRKGAVMEGGLKCREWRPRAAPRPQPRSPPVMHNSNSDDARESGPV